MHVRPGPIVTVGVGLWHRRLGPEQAQTLSPNRQRQCGPSADQVRSSDSDGESGHRINVDDETGPDLAMLVRGGMVGQAMRDALPRPKLHRLEA